MRDKKLIQILLICVLVTSMATIGLPVLPSIVSGASSVTFTMSNVTAVSVGTEVNVTVSVDSPSDAAIIGWEITLRVNPEVLELGFDPPDPPWPLPPIPRRYLNASKAGYFLHDYCVAINHDPDPGSIPHTRTHLWDPAIDNATGTMEGAMEFIKAWTTLTQGTGANGTGTLATFKFTSLSSTGYSPIIITEAYYYTSKNSPSEDRQAAAVKNGNYNLPKVHDVAVTAIQAPPNKTRGYDVSISAMVANLGGYNETFTLEVNYDSTLIDNDTVTLEPLEYKNVTFTWPTTAVTPATYTLNATASLVGDAVPNNNWKTRTIEILPLRDVAVYVSAPAKGGVGTIIPINVTVVNQGDITESSINVTVKYDGNIGNQIISLASGTNTTLTFNWNTGGLTPQTYYVMAEAEIDRDDIPGNNFGTVPIVIGNVTDVEITSISAPATAYVGQTVTITVQAANPGYYTKTFTVDVTYDSSPIDSDTVTLDPDESKTLTFNWNTGGVTPNPYVITAEAILVGDDVPGNNKKNTTITLQESTGGDAAVLSVVPSSSEGFKSWTIQVNVTVKNNGAETISFSVTAYYGTSTWTAIDTLPVTDLLAGENTTLTFDWSLSSLTTCTTYNLKANATLAGDVNTGNNEKVDGTVRVRITGDVSGEGMVTGLDVLQVTSIANFMKTAPPADIYADVSGEGMVTGLDVLIITSIENFMTMCP